MDRKEYWLLREDPFDENLSELDEYRIVFDKTSGEILLSRNNDTLSQPKILTFADPNQTFYPFLFLNGRITALSVFGLIASNVQIKKNDFSGLLETAGSDSHINRTNDGYCSGDDDDSDPCAICYDARASWVLLPCGHLIFCTKCKADYESKATKTCPKCRAPYQETVEIKSD